jgi:menaquinone-9 beta-reductase
MYKCALQLGATVLTNTKYLNYTKEKEHFIVETIQGSFHTEILCGAFGKYAPKPFYKKNDEKHNWVGIKYHITLDHANDEIALHNFEGGYCGMSKIEEGKSCLCYLVQQKQLAKYSNNIMELEKNVLRRNPTLDKIFSTAKFHYEKPMVISNVTFSVKEPTWQDVFYLGDAAGTIAPLSGNGMSNAMRSAYLLHKHLTFLFEGQKSCAETMQNYRKDWLKHFGGRIRFGRFVQHFFCKKNLNEASIRILKFIPFIHKQIINKTHGQSF